MGEGLIPNYIRSIQVRLILWISGIGFLLIGGEWVLYSVFTLPDLVMIALSFVLWFAFAVGLGMYLGKQFAKPTEYLSQAILHMSPTEHLTAAPNFDELKLGRELTTSLARQLYNYATATQQTNTTGGGTVVSELFEQLPVAVLGIDSQGIISLCNRKALATIKLETVTGRPFQSTLEFLSDDETPLAAWMQYVTDKSLTESKSWQKVELKTINGESLGYYDIAVSYSKHSASGVDTVIALYDHSDVYDDESSGISFIAMAVHELRSPLTIMRGYIEAFEDELGTNITPQVADDLRKMTASAEYLTSFVTKILNVTRVDQGQLALNLQEGNWNQALPQIIDSLRNRGAVYDKLIELRMQPNMPSAAIDRLAVTEVITNLIDNAIKYSPDNAAKITVISQINSDGLIETTVQDQGVGIPSSVMPHLFSKFQRNHRNKTQISGTGLGLYLSKAIVTAHHGHIWASSQEGEGSTFGFTLLPFSQLAKDLQTNNNEAIVRSSHGWIKNHSMQRH